MKKLALFSIAVVAFGAVDGTVNNATVGRPQANIPVTLIALGSGMQTVATVNSGSDGKFHFDATLDPKMPYLVQGLHQGVTYNKMIAPGKPATGIALDVYNSSAKSSDAHVTQHMVLIEPGPKDISVSETVIFDNAGTTTVSSPDGTFKFYAEVPNSGAVRVTVQGPQGMPVQRPAEKAGAPNTWIVKAPIKPGETRIDLTYSMPAKSPALFNGKVLHEGGQVRIVVPKGVSLDGPAVRNAGVHPATQATIYEVTGKQFAVAVKGTGTLRETAPPQQEAQPNSEEQGPGIEQVRPMIYKRMPWVLALGLSMLAVGLALLYKSDDGSAQRG